MRKKRPFLLLEVIIAFLLVSLFSTYYLKQSFTALKQSYKQAMKLEEGRIADLYFIYLKQKLWRGDISWKELDDAIFYHLAPLALPKSEEKDIPLTIALFSEEKETIKGMYKKVTVKISFEDKTSFSYQLVAKKA